MSTGENFKHIPVIDISPTLGVPSNDPKFLEVASKIYDASANIGFFYIINHGISQQRLDEMVHLAEQFFNLNTNEKQSISVKKSKNHRGYFGLGEENLDASNEASDLKEGIDFGLELDENDPDVKRGVPNLGPNQWPTALGTTWKDSVLTLLDDLLALGARIIKIIAVALKLPEDYFVSMYNKPNVILRFLKYPPTSEKQHAKQIGCGEHSDYGFLTLLYQDSVGGLQVKNASGEWVDAVPVPGSFVINLGDMMAIATNNKFKATPHRVLNNPTTRSRISIPMFYDPHYETVVSVFPTCTSEDNPPKYPPTTYGEHLDRRLNETFQYRKT